MSEFRSDQERAAWQMVKDLPEFHWSDLEQKGIVKSTAEAFVQRWAKAGRIRQVRKDQHRKIWVNAERECEAEPAAIETTEKTVEAAMWISMSRLKVFTPTEIAAHVNAAGFEATVDRVRAYCRQLLSTGYLRVRQTAIPGKREAAYQLVNDTGHLAPRPVRVRGLFDPNTETFTPFSEVQS